MEPDADATAADAAAIAAALPGPSGQARNFHGIPINSVTHLVFVQVTAATLPTTAQAKKAAADAKKVNLQLIDSAKIP